MGREGWFCWTPPFSQVVKEGLAVCLCLHSFQNLGMTSLRGTCVLVGGVCFQCMVKWRAMNVLWRKGKESEGFWFPADNTELFIPNEISSADQGLKGQHFLTQGLVAVAFENEWKKYTFGHVPDGFVVFVDVFFCPCLHWAVLYIASAFDYFATALEGNEIGTWIRSSRVLPFALIKCSVYDYLRVGQLRINLGVFAIKFVIEKSTEECKPGTSWALV